MYFYCSFIVLKLCYVTIIRQHKLVLYVCNADIPAQKSLKLIVEDDSLNWCTAISQVKLVLYNSIYSSDSLIMQVNV